MLAKERADINTDVLNLKQVSMSRALMAARKAIGTGLLQTRKSAHKVAYTRELRVKSLAPKCTTHLHPPGT